ncbi:hypothetical protein L2E82_27135 [Cichorium intybus]|uniref:Uncharacterized protein n=1 Tax=Cichorium intybus TaxID=13427 RepID=A0ACB9CS97_CICIN|nr:hypothetical protein L2E82_27135 [Cichorium intybus]
MQPIAQSVVQNKVGERDYHHCINRYYSTVAPATGCCTATGVEVRDVDIHWFAEVSGVVVVAVVEESALAGVGVEHRHRAETAPPPVLMEAPLVFIGTGGTNGYPRVTSLIGNILD